MISAGEERQHAGTEISATRITELHNFVNVSKWIRRCVTHLQLAGRNRRSHEGTSRHSCGDLGSLVLR
jgi:hypothetical protein